MQKPEVYMKWAKLQASVPGWAAAVGYKSVNIDQRQIVLRILSASSIGLPWTLEQGCQKILVMEQLDNKKWGNETNQNIDYWHQENFD